MTKRQDIRKELEEIMSNQVQGDPHLNQMKRLQVLNAEVLLEVVETLDKIDENNKKIGEISVDLVKTNTRIQKWVLWLTQKYTCQGINIPHRASILRHSKQAFQKFKR